MALPFDRSNPGVWLSAAAHVALLTAGLVAFTAEKLPEAQEGIPVEMMTDNQVSEITRGETTAAKVQPTPSPRVDRQADTRVEREAGEAKQDAPAPPTRPADVKVAEDEVEPAPAEPPPTPPKRPEIAKAEPPPPTPPARPDTSRADAARAEAARAETAKAETARAEAARAEAARAAATRQEAARQEAAKAEAQRLALRREAEEEAREEKAEAEAERARAAATAAAKAKADRIAAAAAAAAAKAKQEAEAKAEAERRTREAALRAKQEADARARAEQERRRVADARARADAKAKAEAEARARRQAQAADQFSPGDISRLLASRAPAQSTGATGREIQRTASLGAAAGTAQRLNPSQRDQIAGLIREQLIRCWTPPVAVQTAAKPPTAQIRLGLKQDGSLLTEPALMNNSGDPLFRPVADSAIRATKRCAPLRIPSQFAPFYQDWKDLVVDFDPREMG